MKNKNIFKPLDNYEKNLIKDVENNKFVSVKNKDTLIQKLNKNKNINIRLNEQTVEKLKNKAAQTGLPYQTLISTILHQYVSGKINIVL